MTAHYYDILCNVCLIGFTFSDHEEPDEVLKKNGWRWDAKTDYHLCRGCEKDHKQGDLFDGLKAKRLAKPRPEVGGESPPARHPCGDE